MLNNQIACFVKSDTVIFIEIQKYGCRAKNYANTQIWSVIRHSERYVGSIAHVFPFDVDY